MLSHLVAAALVMAPAQLVEFGLQTRAPAVYRLEGYLDDAPRGEVVYFRTVIGFGPQRRAYLITRYSRQGDGDPFLMFRNLGMFDPDFILLGPKQAIEKLMHANPGSRVAATFVYRFGMHVIELDAHSLEIDE